MTRQPRDDAGGVTTRQERRGAYPAAAAVLRPLMRLVTRQDWAGAENLPRSGGFVVCANHISYADPIAVAHFLHDHGHRPCFLAKASLFELPVLGRWIAACGQVPVYRGERRASDAYRDAVAAVEAGRCAVIMPESTTTKDPEMWPMIGKSGAARIALATSAPVLPMSQWGAQDLLTPDLRFRPWRRPVMHVRLGTPVPLDDLRGRPVDAELLASATGRIMGRITAGVEELRGERAPAGAWDPRLGRRVEEPPAAGGIDPGRTTDADDDEPPAS